MKHFCVIVQFSLCDCILQRGHLSECVCVGWQGQTMCGVYSLVVPAGWHGCAKD